MQPQEVPTHLEVPDKLVFGLTARQAVAIGLGLCLGYICYQHTRLLLPLLGIWVVPLILRIGSGLVCAGLGAIIAFVRPLDRPLEIWAIVWLRAHLLPAQYGWQPLPERDPGGRAMEDAVAPSPAAGTQMRQEEQANG